MGIFKKNKVGYDQDSIPGPEQLELARQKVCSRLSPTPLTLSAGLSQLIDRQVFLKWDSKFQTGSFKERGVVNFLLSLEDALRKQGGVCTASAGNHALALSYHAASLNIPCTIVMPKNAALMKVERTKKNGAKVILEGQDFDQAYQYAQNLAKAENLTFVPGFEHPLIIAGQATCGLELLHQCSEFDSVVVSVGGGGLAAGVALAIKAARPEVFILGVQSNWVTNYADQHQSTLIRGTLADGIAVKKMGALTAKIITKYVDQLVSVSDEDIAQAIINYLELEKSLVEGAGAAGLAAVLKGDLPARYTKPAILVCGSNIDPHILSRLIEWDQRKKGRLFRVRVSVPDRPGSLARCTQIISDNGVNVVETFHDRHFSELPGNVDITFLLEVRDLEHRTSILDSLQHSGLNPQVTP